MRLRLIESFPGQPCGWWEGVVVGVDGDDLTLRWMDDPELEPFHLSRRDIALRHPGAD
jgi:hypothetical protein